MKFIAFSALALASFIAYDGQAAIISNDLIGNQGFSNDLSNRIGGSNSAFSNFPSSFNFGQLAPFQNNLGFPSIPQIDSAFGSLNQNQNFMKNDQNLFPQNQDQILTLIKNPNQGQSNKNETLSAQNIDQDQLPGNSNFPNLNNKNKSSFDQSRLNQIEPITSQNQLLNSKPSSSDVNNDILALKSIDRSLDGTKNNPNNPKWGSTRQQLLRLCDANYQDGKSLIWTNLPNPREVSNQIGQVEGPIKQSSLGLNMLFTIWGQFLDHDITLTKTAETDSSQKIKIPVPKCDGFFDKKCTGKEKLPFTRSVFTSSRRVRTNINEITAWIDGSMVYGISKQAAKDLRQLKNGKLKTSDGNMLPTKKLTGEHLAGDARVDENGGLTILHTIFMREHNRLCDIILKKDAKLSDEDVYQIARHYVIGLIQHITFDDYLPRLLGTVAMEKLIGPYEYDETANPNIYTEFSTATYRIGHTLINSPFKKMSNTGKVFELVKLSDMFFNPKILKNDSLNQFLNGMIRTSAKERSLELIDDLRNFLSVAFNSQIKLDLLTLNIQRGRDHGICSINDARQKLGLPSKTIKETFQDQEKTKVIEQLYEDVGNVDLYVAINGQKKGQDGVMGELGMTMNAFQFKKIRNGDRFWYEKAYPASIVKEIKATSLGDIIKRNSEVTAINLDPFKRV